MPDKKTPIFISAGDPSGDIAGSHLMRELDNRGGFEFFGLGGRKMKQAGQDHHVESDQLAVLGFWEVARKFFFFKKLMNETVKLIKNRRPAAVILIDYPGFNLRIAEKIKPLGIPIIYYVSPQIWAWGGKRIHQIKKLVDTMLLILPFETTMYDEAGVKNRYVGHYLLDDIDDRYIKAHYNLDSNLILLMPGSRPQEVQRMLPTMVRTAEKLGQKGDWRFTVAAVESDIDYQKYLAGCKIKIDIIKNRTRELIAESRLVITSSGTATLETGIIGRPMVVIYKTGMLTYLIARKLVKLDKIALINITAGKKIVPELIQNDAVPDKIMAEAERMLENNDLTADIVRQLNETVDKLGTSGASENAAESIMELINC